jgi:hypothetical protein
MKRVLITCSRSYRDWERADNVLAYVLKKLPGAVLVSGHAFRGDQDLERLWEGRGGQVEVYLANWDGPCRPGECKPGHRRPNKKGGTSCPAAGHHRNEQMAQLPDVVLCLAFIGPCTKRPCYSELPEPHGSHGAVGCATYAQARMHIPTLRYPVPGLLA